jgi:hypothetical protein
VVLDGTDVAYHTAAANYLQELVEIYHAGAVRHAYLESDLDALQGIFCRRSDCTNRSAVVAPFFGGQEAGAHPVRCLKILSMRSKHSVARRATRIYTLPSILARTANSKEWKAVVRNTIEMHSRDSANFKGTHVFDHVGLGRWRLA